MFFPESLYLLSQRDQQVSWLDPVLFRNEAAIAAVDLGLNFTVPNGRALILQNVLVYAIGGGAQTVTAMEIALQLPGAGVGSFVYLTAREPVGAAVAQLQWQGSVIVPEKWQVAGNASFSAGAVANTIVTGTTGVLVPIGNMQRL